MKIRLVILGTGEMMDFEGGDIDDFGARFARTEWDLLAPFPEIGFPGGLALQLFNPAGENGATCWELSAG